MTVQQLREALAGLPSNALVVVATDAESIACIPARSVLAGRYVPLGRGSGEIVLTERPNAVCITRHSREVP